MPFRYAATDDFYNNAAACGSVVNGVFVDQTVPLYKRTGERPSSPLNADPTGSRPTRQADDMRTPLTGAATALLSRPSVFTQDDLLDSAGMLGEIERNGVPADVAELERLHRVGLLVPLYQWVDVRDPGSVVDVADTGGNNPRGWVLRAGREGLLRPPADADLDGRDPHERPVGADHRWRNGYLYSSWQALDVPRARQFAAWREHDPDVTAPDTSARTLALCALSSRYLPGIVGQARLPDGISYDVLLAQRRLDVRDLLADTGLAPEDLRVEAESLLWSARRDPMIGWWPVIRHSDHRGWRKVGGPSRLHIWQRIAAEVLLQAHEDLAGDGHLTALPKEPGHGGWGPLRDRIRVSPEPSLDTDLADFGLSPHPKVVLLVEGETERLHLTHLLGLVGLDRPDQVKLVVNGGSKFNAYLLAKYVAVPRLGRKSETSQHLERPPTALVVAMDPENTLGTPAAVEEMSRKLREAVRKDVADNGGRISDAELEHLLRVRTWGDQSYEFANFTDDELVEGITALATGQGVDTVRPGWEEDLSEWLRWARTEHLDVKHAYGHAYLRVDKPALADLLWPTLHAAALATYATEGCDRPVLLLLREIAEIAASLSYGSYALALEDPRR